MSCAAVPGYREIVEAINSCFTTVVKSLKILDFENTNQFMNVYKRPFSNQL